MKNKKYDEDINLLEQIANLAAQKNLTDIEFKKKIKEDTEIFIKISSTQKNLIYEKPRSDKVVNLQKEKSENVNSSFDDEINELKNQPGIISSPMVGTVYLSPEPGVDPFIKVGQNVNIGDTLFIIEAMKTMNQIPSPKSGIVKRILIDDATPVEFDSPLVIIE
tara:strand:+ start:698 stop:1189 length:492 start_codon:yes stop_codon:yes gene_type:complete